MTKGLLISTVTITFFCVGFLIFQTTKCILKFARCPKGTDVGIHEASEAGYPAITICPLLNYNENQDYIDILDECNLTPEEYFEDAKWIGEGPSFCKNPAELYEKIILRKVLALIIMSFS